MEKRMDILKTEPASYKAMAALEKYSMSTPLDKIHRELIKIRASQINGCTYCINMHTIDARKLGETEQRIYLLAYWRESDLYTVEEKAILALTEEVTLISQKGVSDETYQKAVSIFGEVYTGQLIMAIITINAWNRIGVSFRIQSEIISE